MELQFMILMSISIEFLITQRFIMLKYIQQHKFLYSNLLLGFVCIKA